MRKTSITPAAETAAAQPALAESERAVFTEVLSRGEALRKHTEEAIVEFGEWLFTHVFGEDSTSAIHHRQDNALWNAIADAADSPRLRLSLELIERTTLCAAYDRRLNSDAWRALDYARKSRLLRLSDDKLLRKAAQHVLSSNLTTRTTEAYVRALLLEQGEAVQTRVSLGRVQSQVAKFSERLEDSEFLRRLAQVSRDSDDDARDALMQELDRAQAAIAKARARVQKKR